MSGIFLTLTADLQQKQFFTWEQFNSFYDYVHNCREFHRLLHTQRLNLNLFPNIFYGNSSIKFSRWNTKFYFCPNVGQNGDRVQMQICTIHQWKTNNRTGWINTALLVAERYGFAVVVETKLFTLAWSDHYGNRLNRKWKVAWLTCRQNKDTVGANNARRNETENFPFNYRAH